MPSRDTHGNEFVSWVRAYGYVSPKVILTDFSEQSAGRGIKATQNIAKGETIFSIAKASDKIFTAVNSSLYAAYTDFTKVLDEWSALILALMYECSNTSAKSKFAPYISVLPATNMLTTPMFWKEDDLKLLQGTSIVGRIGKNEAEQTFKTKIFPVVQSNPNIFPNPDAYSLDLFHRCGSIIMSYSFHIRIDDQEETTEDGEEAEEDEEERHIIALVPMADMFNADEIQQNVRLCDEADGLLRMVATKEIPHGTQVFNTYGDLPTAELLRRYGYINEQAPSGSEIAEFSIDLVAQAANSNNVSEIKRRIEAMNDCEMIDDSFEVDLKGKPEPALVLCSEALLLDSDSAFDTWLKSRTEEGYVDVSGTSHILRSSVGVRTMLLALIELKLQEYAELSSNDDDVCVRTARILQQRERMCLDGMQCYLHAFEEPTAKRIKR